MSDVAEVPTTDQLSSELAAIRKQCDYTASVVFETAKAVQRIERHFDMILAGLMASPIGPALRKQVEAHSNA